MTSGKDGIGQFIGDMPDKARAVAKKYYTEPIKKFRARESLYYQPMADDLGKMTGVHAQGKNIRNIDETKLREYISGLPEGEVGKTQMIQDAYRTIAPHYKRMWGEVGKPLAYGIGVPVALGTGAYMMS